MNLFEAMADALGAFGDWLRDHPAAHVSLSVWAGLMVWLALR